MNRVLDRRIKYPKFSLWLILRISIAVLFALPAFIFSEVVPDIPPFSHTWLRVAITTWFGLLGYGVFPDLARWASVSTINISNAMIARVSNEVMTQMMRLNRPGQGIVPPLSVQSPIGGVSVSLPLILDTSAIIDGRILDIAKTGFIFGTILIPAFVLTELQQVADSSDYLKRARGRKGFELIDELKKTKNVRVEIWDNDVASKQVDDKLIKLAKNLHGRIITTDYNLNRVAALHGTQVLNINDLANSLKTVAVPGEKISTRLLHLGKDSKQGVGYLNDGTMIVVEDGGEKVGSEVTAEVTRMLQSSAGRMIFAKINTGGKAKIATN